MPSSAAQSTKTRGSETGSVAVKPGVEWEAASYVYVQICLWWRRAALISLSSLRRVGDAAAREGRVRVLAVVAAREHDPGVDVVLAAVPEEVVLGGRLAGDEHVAAGEARVRRPSPAAATVLKLRRPGLVHSVQVRVRAEPAVLLPEAVHGAEVRAPVLRLERRHGRRRTCSGSSGCSRSGSTSRRTAPAGRPRRPSAPTCRATSAGRSCSRRPRSGCRSPSCSARAGTRRGS